MRIIEKYSDVQGAEPALGSLAPGEIALNIADAKIFLEVDSGNVVEHKGWKPGLVEVTSMAERDAFVANGTIIDGQYSYFYEEIVDAQGFHNITEYLQLWSGGVWYDVEIRKKEPLIWGAESVIKIRNRFNAKYVIIGGAVKYSNNGGVSWVDCLNDTKYHILPGAGTNCLFKEVIPHTVSSLIIDDDIGQGSYIRGKIFASGGALTNARGLFWDLAKATEIDASKLNTFNVVNMSNMFRVCKTATKIDISGFNTDSVVDMSAMFIECYVVKFLDTATFGMGNVNTTSNMFKDCHALECIPSINTKAVTDKTNMFSGCNAMVQPDATIRAELVSAPGTAWINSYVCE